MYGLILTALLAGAAPSDGLAATAPSTSTQAQPAAATRALDSDALGSIDGKQGPQPQVLSDQNLSATSSGNTVNAQVLNSGDIQFTSGALQGFNGVGNFVVNTGANNNLQGAISITIVTR